MREIDWPPRALTIPRGREVSCFVAKLGGNVVAKSKLIRGLAAYDSHGGGIAQQLEGISGRRVNGNRILRELKEKTTVSGLKVLEPSAFESDKPAVQVIEKIRVGRQGNEFFNDCLETVGTRTKRF
jgi:hypothetical protein